MTRKTETSETKWRPGAGSRTVRCDCSRRH